MTDGSMATQSHDRHIQNHTDFASDSGYGVFSDVLPRETQMLSRSGAGERARVTQP